MMAHITHPTLVRFAAISLLAASSLAGCGGGSSTDNVEKVKQTMPVGFQAENAYGVIQVDQDYANHQLVASGTAYADSAKKVYITYNGGGYAPILCIRPNKHAVVFVSPSSTGGGTWELRGPDSVEYWVFAAAAVADTSPGLSVYTSDGRLAFNSNSKPLRVHGQVNVPLAQNTFVTSTYIGSDRKLAACISTVRGVIVETGGPVANFTFEGIAVEGAYLTTQPVVTGSIPWNGPSQDINMSQTTVTVVDVTGY